MATRFTVRQRGATERLDRLRSSLKPAITAAIDKVANDAAGFMRTTPPIELGRLRENLSRRTAVIDRGGLNLFVGVGDLAFLGDPRRPAPRGTIRRFLEWYRQRVRAEAAREAKPRLRRELVQLKRAIMAKYNLEPYRQYTRAFWEAEREIRKSEQRRSRYALQIAKLQARKQTPRVQEQIRRYNQLIDLERVREALNVYRRELAYRRWQGEFDPELAKYMKLLRDALREQREAIRQIIEEERKRKRGRRRK